MLPINKAQPLEEIWRETQLILQRQMTRATYETILQGTKLLALREDACCIQVPTSTARDWLEYRLKAKVLGALASVLGREVEVEFVVVPAPAVPGEGDSVSTPGLPELPAASALPGEV